MRYTKIYRWLFTFCLIAYGFSLSASSYSFDLGSEQTDSTPTRYIVFFDILQPMVFGKAGIALSIKKSRLEYLLYANRIFERSHINEDPFEKANGRNWGSYARKPYAGFETGAQIRFPIGSNWEKQSYAEYIVDDSMISGYYLGSWAELVFKKMQLDYSYQTVQARDVKMGGLFGWSGANSRIGVDLFAGFGVGIFSAVIKDVIPLSDRSVHSLLVVYKVGFKFGIKL